MKRIDLLRMISNATKEAGSPRVMAREAIAFWFETDPQSFDIEYEFIDAT